MKHLLCFFVLLLSHGSYCLAQLSLDSCRHMAERNYPLICQYDLIARSADLTVKNIRKALLPQISMTTSGTVQNRISQLPEQLEKLMSLSGLSYSGLGKAQYRVGVDVNQVLWDGNRVETLSGVARSRSAVDAAQTSVSMYEVYGRVEELFFSVLLCNKHLRLNADLVALLQNNERKLMSHLRRGTAMQSDVDRLKAERFAAEQQIVELQALRKSLNTMLGHFCGIDSPDSLQRPSLPASSRVEMQIRPELRLADARLQLVDAQVHQLGAELKPRLSAFAQGYYGYPGLDMFADMRRRTPSLNGILGLRLTWNVGALYTHRNELRKLAVQREQAENTRAVFLFNNRLDIIRKQAEADGRRKVLAADDEIVALRISIRQTAEAQFSKGVIDSDGLLREITRENQARIERATHQIELLRDVYALRRLNGNLP